MSQSKFSTVDNVTKFRPVIYIIITGLVASAFFCVFNGMFVAFALGCIPVSCTVMSVYGCAGAKLARVVSKPLTQGKTKSKEADFMLRILDSVKKTVRGHIMINAGLFVFVLGTAKVLPFVFVPIGSMILYGGMVSIWHSHIAFLFYKGDHESSDQSNGDTQVSADADEGVVESAATSD